MFKLSALFLCMTGVGFQPEVASPGPASRIVNRELQNPHPKGVGPTRSLRCCQSSLHPLSCCGGSCLFYEESLLKSWAFDARKIDFIIRYNAVKRLCRESPESGLAFSYMQFFSLKACSIHFLHHYCFPFLDVPLVCFQEENRRPLCVKVEAPSYRFCLMSQQDVQFQHRMYVCTSSSHACLYTQADTCL